MVHKKCVISGAFSSSPWRNQWHSVSFSAWAFLPPHLILLSASSFYRLQIGVAHSWAGHLLTAVVRPDIRDGGEDTTNIVFFPWDPTKLRLSPEARGTTHEQTGKRTNGPERAAKRLWRFVTGVKAAARDLGPSTLLSFKS